MNLLPAVLVGGPPHAGKTVLLYSLSRALQKRGVSHYVIRACPDGEGNWSQESDQNTVSQIRLKHAGAWPPDFIRRVSHNIEHRCMPFLVDMGGTPHKAEITLFRQCTHAVLLLKDDQPDATQRWHELITASNLLTLAELTSQLEGTSQPVQPGQDAIITGIISHLERGCEAEGPVFEALVERIARLFASFTDQVAISKEQAPTELLDLEAIVPGGEDWQTDMLAPLLAGLPTSVSYSITGRAANWVYAALAGHIEAPIYQFNTRLSWLQPVPLCISTDTHPEIAVTLPYLDVEAQAMRLKITLLTHNLEYFQPEPLPFPPVNLEHGLIIDGGLPQWLVTALVRLYKGRGVPWIATFEPRIRRAIVVYSRTEAHCPGDLVLLSNA